MALVCSFVYVFAPFTNGQLLWSYEDNKQKFLVFKLFSSRAFIPNKRNDNNIYWQNFLIFTWSPFLEWDGEHDDGMNAANWCKCC